MDIDIINLRRNKAGYARTRENKLAFFLFGMIAAGFFILLGYILCIKLGVFNSPPIDCCIDGLTLDFDFTAIGNL